MSTTAVRVFPMKCSIHLELTGAFCTYLHGLNRVLVQRCQSKIDFSANTIPHLTLLRGLVDSRADLEEILNVLKMLAPKQPVVEILLSRPYLEKIVGHYLMMDILDEAPIRAMKRELYRVCAQRIKVSTFGGPDNQAHVTLGYVEDPTACILSEILVPFAGSATCQRIGVSEAGEFGACQPAFYQVALRT